MLELGIKAPDFELPDQDGVMHKLSDYAGKSDFYIFIQTPDNTTPLAMQQGFFF